MSHYLEYLAQISSAWEQAAPTLAQLRHIICFSHIPLILSVVHRRNTARIDFSFSKNFLYAQTLDASTRINTHLCPHGAESAICCSTVGMKSDCHSVAVAGEGTWDGAARVLLTGRDSIVGHLNIVITIF